MYFSEYGKPEGMHLNNYLGILQVFEGFFLDLFLCLVNGQSFYMDLFQYWLVAVVPADEADAALDAIRSHGRGREAAAIGRVATDDDGLCELLTDVGGSRVLQKPYGEELPRIC